MCEKMYGTIPKTKHEALFKEHCDPGTLISAQNATTYTCPLYASLLSLALADMADFRVLCMSYGSGCAASMYGLRANRAPYHASDVLIHLSARCAVPIEDALLFINSFELTHGRFGFKPSDVCDRQDGAYYV